MLKAFFVVLVPLLNNKISMTDIFNEWCYNLPLNKTNKASAYVAKYIWAIDAASLLR